MKGQKTTARLSISGIFRNGRVFSFPYSVESEMPQKVDERVKAIRQSIFEGVGRKNVFVLGIHVIDLEQVCFMSVMRRGFGEKEVKVKL